MKSVDNPYLNFFKPLPKQLSDMQIQAAVLYWFSMLNSDVYSVNANENKNPRAGFREFIALDNKKYFFAKLRKDKPRWEDEFKEGLTSYLKQHRTQHLILATDYSPEDDLAAALNECLPELLVQDIFPHDLSMTFGVDDIISINGVDVYAEDIIQQFTKKSDQSSYFFMFAKALGCPRLVPAIQNLRRSLGF